jgi:hypothetical protein
LSQPKTGADQHRKTLRSPSNLAYITPRVAGQAAAVSPLVNYNAPVRVAAGKAPLARSKAPGLLTGRWGILKHLMWATIWDGEQFVIVDAEGAYCAAAGSMSGLIPWIAGYAELVDRRD